MTKTFARLHLAHNRIMSALIIKETPEYYDVQVVKDSFWNTNDFIKVSKSLVKTCIY
jgi:hypothetical protein